MPGASISPVGVINLIQDNLRDRYDSGFPVLKEVIQNADDAQASSLVMGWCNGIADADNPLLHDPALFFINDAPLLKEHAAGIMSVAEGSKASAKASVGKFGLGMKSLFHFCEAFFFEASTWQQDDWAANVFNPWDEFRPEWDDFQKADKQKIENKFSSILKKFTGSEQSSWFVVWVPLRTKERIRIDGDNEAIIGNYEEPDSPPEFLFAPDLAEKTADIFPLLKCLEQVELLVEHDEDFVSRFHIGLGKGSQRSSFCGDPLLKSGATTAQWKGDVVITFAGVTNTLNYAGVESLLNIKRLTSLKSEAKGWPVSLQHDPQSRRPKKAPDKAEQHVAVVISRMPAEGQAVVTASWAVFLPLADTQEFKPIPIDGEHSYHFHLHGYFFVDAGRKGIHGHSYIGSDADFAEIGTDEKLLRRAWNLTLANEGTLDLLLPAFQYFIKTLKIKKSDVNRTSGGIDKLFSTSSKYLERVTSRYNWVYRLTPEKRGWELVEGAQMIRLLPKPDSEDYQRIWDTFPWVVERSENICFAESGKNNIISKFNTRWPLQDLEELLSVNVSEVFSSQANFGYFTRFLGQLDQLEIEQIQDTLIRVGRESLKQVLLTTLSKQTALFKEFSGYIYRGSRLALPIEKSDEALWEVLGSLNTDVFIVPKFIDSDDGGSAPIGFDDAISILTALDQCLRRRSKDEEFIDAVERVIRDVLNTLKQSSRSALEALYKSCGDLRLFNSYDLRSKKDRYQSRNEILELRKNSRLFLRSGPKNISRSFGHGQELLDSVQTEIFFLSREVKALLFDNFLAECNDEAVLKCLALHPPLASESKRLNLLHKISGASLDHSEYRRGFRYLLHGCNEDKGHLSLWKNAAHGEPVWLKLWKQHETSDRPEWTVISSELSEVLNDRIKRELDVYDISPETILSKMADAVADIDFSALNLTQNDRDAILGRVTRRDLWRRIPLHETVQGEWIEIDDRCVLNGAQGLPENFEFIEIKRASNFDVELKQKTYIGEVDEQKLIRIALTQEIPENHADFILDQLITLHKRGVAISDETHDLLKNTRWLMLENGSSIPLSRLLILEQEAWPESIALCERDDTDCYSLQQLNPSLLANDQYLGVIKKYAKQPGESCRLLISEAVKLSEYVLGEIGDLTCKAIDQLQGITMPSALPGWGLICELRANLKHEFVPENANPLFAGTAREPLIEVLEQLSGQSADKVADARSLFLKAICQLEQPVPVIEKIKLRTQADTFRKATDLAFDVEGISSGDLVHPDDWRLIKGVMDEFSAGNPVSVRAEKLDCYKSRRDALKSYFKDWGKVSPDAIGAFMALMATKDEEVRALADSFFKYHEYQGIFDTFVEAINEGEHSDNKEKIDIHPVICETDRVEVSSIFGRSISMQLDQTPKHILFLERKAGLFGPQPIQLRKLNIDNFTKDELLLLLKSSTELILESVFGRRVNLGHLWEKFGQSSQLDIRLAELSILDEIVSVLERLRVKKGRIGELIQKHRKAKRLALESPNNLYQLEEVKKEIQTYIKTDKGVQGRILEGVRREIGDHSQYFPDSVPFELFQNADDAFGERIMLGKKEAEGYPRKFIVRNEPDALSFYHWGREVNYCPASYEKGKGKFDYDLEKMVKLNISDKDEHVTGKFGLGFKSCLLVCDSPELLSGEIAARILGGILPSVINDRTELMKRVNEVKVDGPCPTLIRLQLRENAQADNILDRFRPSAGLLCVFSRHIRTIELGNETIQWTPRKSSRIDGLSLGMVKLPHDGALKAQRVIHYRTSKGQFIFQIGLDGLMSLAERSIPKFWVTNPIQEELAAGFIVEGNFQVDIGRSQLAKDNAKNIEVMGMLGRELSVVLGQIFQWASEDWHGFCREWSLREQLEPVKFWASVWNVLTTGWSKSTDGKAVLFQTLFTAQGGLLDFYSSYAAMPNRLGKRRHSLISLKNVSYRADKLLTTVFDDLSGLEKLQDCISKQNLIDDDAGRLIEGFGFSQLRVLTLADIIDEHIKDKKVTSENASVLGRLFNEKVREKLAEASTAEFDDLCHRLSEYRFQDESGRHWNTAGQLTMIEDPSSEEERLLYGFAPSYGRLSPEYNEVGQVFFKQCRGGTKPSFNTIEDWARAISAQDNVRQGALMRYLISGFNGKHIARKLKGNREPDWMLKINESVLLESFGWTTYADIDEYIRLMKDSLSDIHKRVDEGIKNSPATYSSKESLSIIYEWWADTQADKLPEYDKKLYSKSMPWGEMQSGDLDSQDTRKAWLKLFYLGVCQTIGRAKEEQNRAAIDWIERKGWWDRMASEDMEPEDWTGIIDEYLADAEVNESYRIWLQILPLYNFSKNLETYVHQFLSIGSIQHLDDVLKSAESPLWQGTGEYVPALRSSMGIGANFVIRELIRHNVLQQPETYSQAFVLPEKVRWVINKTGCSVSNFADPYESERVFNHFLAQLGDGERASFDLSFDIPFRILAADPDFMHELLGVGHMDFEDEQE